MELGRRRAGRGKQHNRFTGGLGEADPEERAGALVDVDEDANLGVTLEGDGNRRRPGARRNARELNALRGELIDESCGERLRYIHTISV